MAKATRVNKSIFLSYRRSDVAWALAIYVYLQERGYDIFFDFTGLAGGRFEDVIVANIKARAHFLLVLTSNALERCSDPDDWLRKEIETAIQTERNIVPLMIGDFDFNAPAVSKQLTGQLSALKDYNGLSIPEAYFGDAMKRLCNKYLAGSVDTKLHRISTYAHEAARREQIAANVHLASAPQISAEPKKDHAVTRSEEAPRAFLPEPVHAAEAAAQQPVVHADINKNAIVVKSPTADSAAERPGLSLTWLGPAISGVFGLIAQVFVWGILGAFVDHVFQKHLTAWAVGIGFVVGVFRLMGKIVDATG